MVKCEHDGDYGPPWEACDGHGPVSEWTTRENRAGEMVLTTDHGRHRFYDFAGAVKLARRDGWDTPPYQTDTAGERAHRAATADYEYLHRWCADLWSYIGVCVMVSRNGEEIGSDSLWGVESDGDYWQEVAVEMIEGIVSGYEQHRKATAVAKRKETCERHYWEARGVLTMRTA
jgi:hypothetical protein